MDSFSLQFGSMNSLDLKPVNFEVSRLSPAKSTSSIDQFAHHHGKGDSAYSSFSGCSNAPDHASPFLSDELNAHSLPYTDLKYVKAVYNPNILNSNHPKSMDQLFKSVEAISQHHHCQESSLAQGVHKEQNLSPPLLPPPPTPPARLDSFITTKNMEDYKTKVSPDSQSAEKSHQRSSVHNTGRVHPRHDPVCGRGVSQPNLEDLVGQGGLNQTWKQSQFSSTLSQSSPTAVLPESQSENQRKRSRSDHALGSAEQSARDAQRAKQNVISSNVQHKGQYYFVTGVSSDSNFRNSLSSVAEGKSMRSVSEGPPPSAEVRGRLHSCTDNVNRGVRRRHWSSNDLQGGTDVCCQSPDTYSKKQDVESRRRSSYSPSYVSKQEFHSLDSLDEKTTGGDIGLVSHRHHSSSHHIFYCGPEDRTSPVTHSDKDMIPTVLSTEQRKADNADPLTQVMTRSLGDLPSDKISKESTPLLYHLTGASRGTLMNWPKNSGDASETQRETRKSTAFLRQWSKEEHSCSSSGDRNSVEQSSACRVDLEQCQYALGSSTGTVDDSFKKYYKEKLKDAQSKVLRETSFKRKDLLLSWPHRVKQRPEPQLTALMSVIGHRDLKATFADAENSDVGSEVQGKENRNENNEEEEEEEEKGKENGKLSSFPQLQITRIGSRRRLVAEQKKLCYSEPEKLHQVGAAPLHVTCSSLGNEKEALLSADESSEEGLVASRKMFETKNRTFSGIAKNTLKQIQIKALVAYMERKISHKTAEPQHPPPAHRHSTAGKPPEWVLRPLSGNAGPRRRLLRPHSAGSSAKGSSWFGPIHSFQEPPQSSWKVFAQPAKGLLASTQCLMDLPEQTESPQACPTSAACTLQNERNVEEPSLSFTERSRSQMKAEGEKRMNRSRETSVPAAQWIRSVALRGKSMEELGVTRVNTTPVLSRSSEQLDQLSTDRDKSVVLFREEQKQAQLCAPKNLLVKQDSAPELTCARGSDTYTSGAPKTAEAPVTSSPCRARASSVIAGPSSPSSVLPNIVGNSVFYTGNIRPIFSLNRFLVGEPSHTSPSSLCSPATSSTLETALPAGSLSPELSVRHQAENLRFGSEEVSLSCGVTTDPRSCFAPRDKRNKNCEEPHSSPEDSSIVEVLNPSPVPECVEPPAAQSTPPPAVTHVVQIESARYSRPQKEEHKNEEAPVSAPETLEDNAVKGEAWWERLVEEVVAEDQSLARVLLPAANRKTAVMLMEQLLSEDTLLMEEHYRKKHEEQAEERYVEGAVKLPDGGSADLKLKTQKAGPVQNGGAGITERKRALIACIEGGLRAIEVQHATLRDQMRANTLRGGAVDALVQKSCLPAEYERYASFVGDLERVVSLLLCLSARLARVLNALSAVGDHADAEEKQSLDNRHRLLCKQREDATDLKENLDRRERVVSAILARHLTAEQLQDYRHFIQTAAALLIRQKDLDERKRLWEEQLESLLNSISP